MQRDQSFTLIGPSGDKEPVQSWPTAFWPDGSVKWTAHAVSLSKTYRGMYFLSRSSPPSPNTVLTVKEMEKWIEVDTGKIVCRIHRQGTMVIDSIRRSGITVCSGSKLICLREARYRTSGVPVYREEVFHSNITQAVVEQRGPLRGVVRIEGRHRLVAGGREWIPFKLRLYFYANQDSIKVVHTFLYDGNPHQDFIKGIGITFSIPLGGPLYNRHVRIAGDTGFFGESPKNLATTRTEGKYRDLYQLQHAGQYIEMDEKDDSAFLELLDDSAVWDSFKLVQDSSDHYSVLKRTKEECCWLKAAHGHRSGGLVYAGGEGGGMAAGMRNFWQKYPSSIEIGHMSRGEAELKVWFWSPDAQAMDLRHYDTSTHVRSSYEGADELRSTPYGIGNTNELRIWCLDRTPGFEELQAMVMACQSPALLVCEPKHYYQTKAFGVWSLPDRSTPAASWLEDRLEAYVRIYRQEIEQRRWYGFWDYGDVMHSYDPVRHTWRYDIGGCAWQNTELVPNMWLWYMFLRTGREDIFRMAEAMTRHTSEVDLYHIGEYAGLGSRHNVVHWGCSAKEARIGMAGLHRFYYYLTGDERIGDIMDEAKDADYSTLNIDPMRIYFPKDEFPTHTRIGPDWAAFTSNWMTRWERFEDTAYRDKILEGITCLKQMPYRLLTGPTFGYDPKTGKLYHMGKEIGNDNYIRHLVICMGAPQVWFELAPLLRDEQWEEMMAEFGEFYHLDDEEKARRTSGAIRGKNWSGAVYSAAMVAFAAAKRDDKQLARLAWDILLQDKTLPVPTAIENGAEYIRTVEEVPGMSTNYVSQWSLNTIVCLELIGTFLPAAWERS